MQPALLETRSEMLHGQLVEVKVYGPGRGHDRCQRPWCALCWLPRRDDIDRLPRWNLDDIEKRWPVALGIEPGYSEPVSGRIRVTVPASFDPAPYATRFEPKVDPFPRASSDFYWANSDAAYRLFRKREEAATKQWTPERRKAASIKTKKYYQQRGQRERQRQEKIAAYEASFIHCEDGECKMGEWVSVTNYEFRQLVGRNRTRFENGLVAGCQNCPNVESQIA